MNSKLIFQIDAGKAGYAVCLTNIVTVTPQVAFAAEVPKLLAAINVTTPFLNQLAVDTKGITTQKTTYKRTMAKAAASIVKLVKGYALAIADPNILQEINFSVSDILNVRANLAISRATAVFSVTTTLLPSLANYGVTSVKLAALQADITSFTNYQTKPQEAAINKFDSNKELLIAVETIHDIIERMKLMAEVFKPINIAFYNKFIEATKVKQTGKRHDAVIGSIYDHNNHLPMPAVVISYPGIKKPKRSGKKGGFRVKNLAPGIYTFTFTFYGYHPAQVTVYVNAGVTTRLKVELVPLALPANQSVSGTTVIS